MIVVDASLAAKWVLDESSSRAAQAYLDSNAGYLIAPDLLAVEVGGAIVRHANMDEISAADALATLEAWNVLVSSGSIHQLPTAPGQLLEAGRLAIELRHPFKDCIYLALAIDLDCPLATSDARLAKKASARLSTVMLLGDDGSEELGPAGV